ncbi:MAG: hypothetical protein BGO11_16210 [Solirubrobacterales bacterium 70-9]|nr:MAG: hypothetical protein BGO11_16210 [Solirubrobacterales bacterium 70-9]
MTIWTTGFIALVASLIVSGFLVGGAGGETVRQGGLQVSFGGSVAPEVLPRVGTTPVSVAVRGRVWALGGGPPPSLRRIAIEVNRLGVLDRRGLPVCPAQRLQAASTADALAACGEALVGEGRVGGLLVLPEQVPFPFGGRVVAFNGRMPDGSPAVLAHLFADRPVPLAFVLAFRVGPGHGVFGTRLVADVPARTRQTAHITSFSLRLHRVFEAGGERRGYLSAGCPAPAGFTSATFPLLRANYAFVGHKTVADTLVRTCRTG